MIHLNVDSMSFLFLVCVPVCGEGRRGLFPVAFFVFSLIACTVDAAVKTLCGEIPAIQCSLF